MRVVVSSPGISPAAVEIARALSEHGMLARYETTFAYKPQALSGQVMSAAMRLALGSRGELELARRTLGDVPGIAVRMRPFWEVVRVGSARLGANASVVDRIWERTVRDFDEAVARRLESDVDAVYGYEHACKATFERARELGLRAVFDMAAPHYSFVERVLSEQYAAFPYLRTGYETAIEPLGAERNKRKQRELDLATLVIANSRFTARTLIESGYPEENVRVVPRGAPPIDGSWRTRSRPKVARFLFAGTASARKGAHLLLDAWRRLSPGREVELVIAGTWQLPEEWLRELPPSVRCVGSIPRSALYEEYRNSAVLVFPSLCDGFGMVVTEALAHGLPVITTSNVGAADLLEDGRGGFVLPPGDVDALAERLAWCLDHPDELWGMREGAEQAASTHAWTRYRGELMPTLCDHLGQSLPRPLPLRAKRKRVCIVTSGCVSSGPRVEKEADELSAAGFDVHVVALHGARWMEEWDRDLVRNKRWRLHPAPATPSTVVSRGGHAAARLIQVGARRVMDVAGSSPSIATLAISDRLAQLAKRAISIHADLYIAHNLPALPVAATAALIHGARLAFDSEDDHLGELSELEQQQTAGRIVDALQSRWLPACSHVTVPSADIGAELSSRYGIVAPTVVHNVFPLSLRDEVDGEIRDRRGARVSLYWYSQTIGLDRGLQDLVRAAARLEGDFEIHLRGTSTAAVRDELRRIAQEGGLRASIYFHPQVPPWELLSRAMEHDIGCALEQPVSRNRLLTVTNKIFFYMVAGLAVAATTTPGQRRVMEVSPEAGLVYEPGDHEALARKLQRWLDHPEALAAARAAAREAARTRWAWEHEGRVLVRAVTQSLGGP